MKLRKALTICLLSLCCCMQAQHQNTVSDAELQKDQPYLECASHVFARPGIKFVQPTRLVSPTANTEVRVSDLPKGLHWNAERNRVEGIINQAGEYVYHLSVLDGDRGISHHIRLTVSDSLQQPTPFMGWLSWNVFEEEIDERKMLDMAHTAKCFGLDTLGYRYFCLDDWWHSSCDRPEKGLPDYDHNKFPHGMKWLTDTLHRLGFKAGIYSDAAEHTCAGAFGSVGFEAEDAKQYAAWGFDLLKYDYCGAPKDQETAMQRYKKMGDALKASGRDFLFYMCEWGQREPWLWGAETGASTWRCTYDSRDFWDWGTKSDAGHLGVIQGIDVMKHLWPYSGVNRFNDADMLMVGLEGEGKSSSYDAKSYHLISGEKPAKDGIYRGMTEEEYRSQISLWAMFASPLTLSFDLRKLFREPHILKLISNKEIIDIDQDRLGLQAELLKDTTINGNCVEIYEKELENGDVAVAFFNRGADTVSLKFDMKNFHLPKADIYRVRDVWDDDAENCYVVAKGQLATKIGRHAVKVYRISKKNIRIILR